MGAGAQDRDAKTPAGKKESPLNFLRIAQNCGKNPRLCPKAYSQGRRLILRNRFNSAGV